MGLGPWSASREVILFVAPAGEKPDDIMKYKARVGASHCPLTISVCQCGAVSDPPTGEPDAVLMLGQRRRRWSIIETTSVNVSYLSGSIKWGCLQAPAY